MPSLNVRAMAASRRIENANSVTTTPSSAITSVTARSANPLSFLAAEPMAARRVNRAPRGEAGQRRARARRSAWQIVMAW